MNIFLQYYKPILEIILLWYVLYILFMFLKGSRAFQVFRGIVILIVVFFITQTLGLTVINWILTKLFTISVIAFIIIFQPELRRGLARIGRNPVFGTFIKEEKIIDEIVRATVTLSRKKIGGLIAIEREIGLKPYIESGVSVDSNVTSEMIISTFMPTSPLHDGGIVIEGGRIAAAGCLFPLSQNINISKKLGTRHRAAIGLSEETDAVILVISEETGIISAAMDGRLTRELDRESITSILRNLYRTKREKRSLSDIFGSK